MMEAFAGSNATRTAIEAISRGDTTRKMMEAFAASNATRSAIEAITAGDKARKMMEAFAGSNATRTAIEAISRGDTTRKMMEALAGSDAARRAMEAVAGRDAGRIATEHFRQLDEPIRRAMESFRNEQYLGYRPAEAIASANAFDLGLNSKSPSRFDALWSDAVEPTTEKPAVAVHAIIIPERSVAEGILVQSTSLAWISIVRKLKRNWKEAFQIPSEVWEEIIAGAFKEARYDEVILTPRSGDHGRDVVAMKRGVGSIKIIGSVKAYGPGKLVRYDDVRALLGVLSGEQNASKGLVATTSGFPPRISEDPFIAPFLPTRLELMDGEALRQWLKDLIEAKPD
jgi:restriction system protein